MIGVPRLNYNDLRGAACIACDYSLAGLDPASKCPECGTLIAESLRTTPFPGMSQRDARLLARGCRALLWTFLVPFVHGLLAIILLMIDGLLELGEMDLEEALAAALAVLLISGLGIPALLWLFGWTCLGMVRTPGAGTGARSASVVTMAFAVAQFVAIPFILFGWSRSDPMAVVRGVLFVPLWLFMMALAGQWRLTGLCLRSREPGLIEGGRDVLRLQLIVFGHVVVALALLFVVPAVSALFGMIATFLCLLWVIGWLAFLAAVRRAAMLTLKGRDA